ncbi:MAG: hypothetical protein KJ668_07020, partial [Proteobacteria bacterium]|nr:hypothetical protein [Pseudomonadota bacterium]
MHGFYNRLITINLTNQTYEITPVPDRILTKYLGGKGLASWLLYKHNPVGV